MAQGRRRASTTHLPVRGPRLLQWGARLGAAALAVRLLAWSFDVPDAELALDVPLVLDTL
jgi:hypothetical protein